MSAFYLGTVVRQGADVRASSRVEHAELVAAIAAGDGDAAAATMERHLMPPDALHGHDRRTAMSSRA